MAVNISEFCSKIFLSDVWQILSVVLELLSKYFKLITIFIFDIGFKNNFEHMLLKLTIKLDTEKSFGIVCLSPKKEAS